MTPETRYHRELLKTALIYILIIEEPQWDKKLSQYLRKAVEFDPDEYQKLKYHRYAQKSYVPTPLRAPITTREQTQKFLLKNWPSTVPSHNLL